MNSIGGISTSNIGPLRRRRRRRRRKGSGHHYEPISPFPSTWYQIGEPPDAISTARSQELKVTKAKRLLSISRGLGSMVPLLRKRPDCDQTFGWSADSSRALCEPDVMGTVAQGRVFLFAQLISPHFLTSSACVYGSHCFLL